MRTLVVVKQSIGKDKQTSGTRNTHTHTHIHSGVKIIIQPQSQWNLPIKDIHNYRLSFQEATLFLESPLSEVLL